MSVNSVMFQRLNEEHSVVAKDASYIALEATEALKNATRDFSEATAQIKAEHKKDINERDRVIKGLMASLLLVTGLTIYLGVRSLTIKC